MTALSTVSIAASGATLAGAVVSLGLKIYQTAQSSTQLINLKTNIEFLKNEHHVESEPIKAIILKAKLDRLEVLERDISVELAKNVLEGVAGSLALCASVQAILVSAGIVLGGTAAICFNALGVGALVLGTGLAIGGTVYGAYQKRHEIKHTLATAEIAPRKLFNEYALNKEITIYDSANKIFKEMEKRLEILQLTLPAAWDTKQQIDEFKGKDALTKQILITRKFIELQIDLNESTENASEASKTMTLSLPIIKRLQHELRVFQQRQEIEDLQLLWKQLVTRFSKYEVYTLMAVQSILRESLAGEVGRNTIKDLMMSHGYPPKSLFTRNKFLISYQKATIFFIHR
ncbi:MAG: hypothetical protein H0U49_10155 [Parachlamydiaceae bacterium]|nr:hypothetical protein [Parachlamydiaceae bacterium]